MPKNEIDYSNTIIYKIYCKNANLRDVYIGHTTNFIKRKYLHKTSCNNLNCNDKIYKVIRENGGWENWVMLKLAKYNCKSHSEARVKELEHFELLKTILNNDVATTNPYNLHCITSEDYKINENFIVCPKNNCKKLQKSCKKLQKVAKKLQIFKCDFCDYSTSRKSSLEKHTLTDKHKMVGNGSKMVENDSEKLQKKSFLCKCGNLYKYESGYYRHKKICTYVDPAIKEEKQARDTEELIKYLMKENSEFKHLLMDQHKNMIEFVKNTGNYTITNNSNSHNKSFNLQFFLNETCKNAMNITDFINSLQLQLSDLENVGELGYVEGISNIIIKKLNALDVSERPIHCTDKKRETMYIKDEDKWEKEDEKKTKMHKMIRKVANKNIDLISDFKALHPDWKKCSSKYADQFNKIIIESMGGPGDNEYENEEKVIKRVAKEVLIDKNIS